MTSCAICIESFDKKDRKQVTCNFCAFVVCRQCCQKYLLESMNEAHCMNCNREWDLGILLQHFTRKFVDTDYKEHEKRILWEREQALLPATQPLVERRKQSIAFKTEMKKILQEISKLNDQYNALQQSLYALESNTNNTSYVTFVRKCPNEICKGFVNNNWKCNLCDMYSCSHCHEMKGPFQNSEHSCKTENVETAKLLQKDTRPCPKCRVPIFKIDGCDQMWCTQCHTAFSWRTGKLENKIHNPHYFHWLQTNSQQIDRNPLDVQCGREIDDTFINAIRTRNAECLQICRAIIHMRMVDVPRFQRDRINGNQDLRMQYLMNEITLEKFKTDVQKRQKAAKKCHEITNVLGMFIAATTDILYRYACSHDKFNPYKDELRNLINYSNDCFQKISSTYKCTKYVINTRCELL